MKCFKLLASLAVVLSFGFVPIINSSYYPLTIGSTWDYVEVEPVERAITTSRLKIIKDTLVNDTLYQIMASIEAGQAKHQRLYREEAGNIYRRFKNKEFLIIPSSRDVGITRRITYDSSVVDMTVISNDTQTATPLQFYDSLVCVKYWNPKNQVTALFFLKKGVGLVCTRWGDGKLISYLDSCKVNE